MLAIEGPRKSIHNFFFFFQAEDGIRDGRVTGVQTCALPISRHGWIRTVLPRRARVGGLRRTLDAVDTARAHERPPPLQRDLERAPRRLADFTRREAAEAREGGHRGNPSQPRRPRLYVLPDAIGDAACCGGPSSRSLGPAVARAEARAL